MSGSADLWIVFWDGKLTLLYFGKVCPRVWRNYSLFANGAQKSLHDSKNYFC